MKEALGDALDDVTLQAMEVGAAMKDAGATEEEIEEMMAMIMNKGGGISEEFLDSIKKAMDEGSKSQSEDSEPRDKQKCPNPVFIFLLLNKSCNDRLGG